MSLCTSGIFFFFFFKFRTHVLSGENKGVPVPVLLDHSWTVIAIVFVHICSLHVQEKNTSCAGAPAGNTHIRGEHVSPHVALKAKCCKAVLYFCQMNKAENKM